MFLNIQKINFKNFVCNISCFLRVLCYFQHLKNKNFLGVLSHFIVRFMLFSILKKIGNIEKCPFTYWLNGRWFLQIADKDSGNLYPIYPPVPCSDFLSQMWGWFFGGGDVFLTFMLFPTVLEKITFFRKTILFHLMFSSCFFMLDLFPTLLDFF